jgi:hypothetical protein
MYEVTLYDLAGLPMTEPRQVRDLKREAGGLLCRTGPLPVFDLFFPWHRVYEVRHVA